MTAARAVEIIVILMDGPFTVVANRQLADDALQIALSTPGNVTPYDASYVALAVLLNTRFITADRKLFNKLQGSPFGKHVALLADYTN